MKKLVKGKREQVTLKPIEKPRLFGVFLVYIEGRQWISVLQATSFETEKLEKFATEYKNDLKLGSETAFTYDFNTIKPELINKPFYIREVTFL